MSSSNVTNNKTLLTKFLDAVEYLGNLLPHPVTLFGIFCVGTLLLSAIASYFGLSVVDPRPVGYAGRSADGVITVVSLLSGDGLKLIVTNLVDNFVNFAPLGTVLVATLGVAVAEKSGVLSAAMRQLVMGASKRMVTITVVFGGIVSNSAAELGYVVLIPLSAMLFHSLGRHPLAGLAAAFAGVSGGYSANLLIGTVDPLLSGITQAAAQVIDPSYSVGPEVNWYFMIVSTFVISAIGAFVTEKIVEPKLGVYDPSLAEEDLSLDQMGQLSAIEKKGLKWAGISMLIVSALLAWTVVPEDGILRSASGTISGSPFLKSIVALIVIFFAVPGVVYGKLVGTINNDRDVISAMVSSMSSMSSYIVLVFFAAQFVAFFTWSNFGQVSAIVGAQFLQDIGLTGPTLFFAFILMCGVVNLMVGSASAQWAITAPIFVPMLMLVGYAPEIIQAAYRIGDSATNIITPMMAYFGLILTVANRYIKNTGIGTLIAVMLPYSITFIIGWSLLFYVWVFVCGLPVGPGAATYYNYTH